MSAATPRRRGRRPKAAIAQAVPIEGVADAQEPAGEVPGPEGEAFTVEVSPPAQEQEEEESFLDKAARRLGLKEEKTVTPVPRARKLSKQQQEILDIAAPIANQLGIETARFAWGRIAGDEYVPALTPSEDEAARVMVPLVRMAVRRIKLTGRVSPDAQDIAACLTGLAGYVWSSWRMYRHIKDERESYGPPPQRIKQQARSNGAHPAQRIEYTEPEDFDDYAGDFSLPGAAESIPTPVRKPVENSTLTGGVNLANLTDQERANYQRLARLRQLDIQARSRRSGSA